MLCAGLLALALPLAARAVAPGDQLQFADGLFSRGLYDMAVREYLALSTNAAVTNADVALFRAGECYRLMGNRASAADLYRRVADGSSGGTYAGRASFRYAEIAVTGGQYIEAVNRFRALVDGNPPPDILAPALYYLGYAQKKMRLPEEAEKALRRLVREFPDSPYTVLGCIDLADLLIQSGGSDKEIRDLLQRAADRGRGERAGAEALYQLGDHAFRQKDYAAGAEAFARLLKDYPAESRAQTARLPAAWALFRADRAADALAVIESGIHGQTGPALADWLYLQANCLRKLDRSDEAARAYGRLTGEFADTPLALAAVYETAVMAFQAKDYARAYDLATRVQSTPDIALDLAWLQAESARLAGKPDEALQRYERVASDFPANDRTAAARFQAARILQEQGQYADAAERYRSLAKDQPKNDLAADALFAAAYCRVVLKQYDEAVADWDALLAGYPKFATLDEALYGKAQAEVELHREAAARATLEQMLKEYPRSRLGAEAHYLLGTLLEQEGDFEVAEYHYRIAALKKPEASLVRKIEFRRVAVLQRQGHHDDAAAVLNDLIASGGGDEVPASLLDWLARWNLEKKRYDELERAASALAAKAGPTAWQQIGWYFVGRSREARGQTAQAREAYAHSMEVDASTREGVEAALHVGDVAAEEKDWAASQAAFAKAADRAQSDELADIRARSYFGMGRAAAAQKHPEEAARYFMGVAVLYDDPDLTPEALFRAAQSFDEVGRTDDRDKALAELKQRYPESAWASKNPGDP